MHDTSFFDELNESRRERKTKYKYYVAVFAIFTITLSTGVYALQGTSNEKDSTSETLALNEDGTDTDIPVKVSEDSEDPGPDSFHSSPPVLQTTVTSQDSVIETDAAVVKAKICKDLIDNVIEINNSNNDMYFKTWKEWNELYKGSYDTPEAQESRKWYKNYFRNLYKELVNSNNLAIEESCETTTSIDNILLQPDYGMW